MKKALGLVLIKLADNLLHGNVKGFEEIHNAKFGVASNYNAPIERNTDHTVTAIVLAHCFASNFVNSSDYDELKN